MGDSIHTDSDHNYRGTLGFFATDSEGHGVLVSAGHVLTPEGSRVVFGEDDTDPPLTIGTVTQCQRDWPCTLEAGMAPQVDVDLNGTRDYACAKLDLQLQHPTPDLDWFGQQFDWQHLMTEPIPSSRAVSDYCGRLQALHDRPVALAAARHELGDVFKFGNITRLTVGSISRVPLYCGGHVMRFIVEPREPHHGADFALPGDSGALVVDGDGHFVGMVARGGPLDAYGHSLGCTHGVVIPMDEILTNLGLSL